MAKSYRRSRRPETPLIRALAVFPLIGIALAVLALILLWLSAMGYRWDWWQFRTGFGVLRWGAYFGVAAAVVSLVGAVFTRPGSGRPGFIVAVIGLLLGLVAFAEPALQLRTVYALPFIHDITTDTENPPKFVALAEARLAPGNENGIEYGGPEVAAQQKAAYSDIVPAQFAQPKAVVFAQALAVAKGMGWEIADANAEQGHIEATDTTFWFGFKDDVIVRIEDDPNGGTRVDVRSVSRVGRSDVGANAKRIRAFLQRLTSRMVAVG